MNASAEKPGRIRAISNNDIDRPENWPKADSRYCCIFEAINRVGQAKFGDAWTGQELCAMDWPESPQAVDDRQRAWLARGGHVPKAPPPPSNRWSIAPTEQENPLLAKSRPHDAHVAAQKANHVLELKNAAVTADQRLWEANNEALKRLREAVEWLAQKCRDNALRSYARPASGGELSPVQAYEWNVDNPLATFVSAGGPNRPFPQLGRSSLLKSYIFFDRVEIDRVTATLTHVPSVVAGADLSKLSPYLQFAVRLALAKDYTSPENLDTKEALQAEIRQHWPEFRPDIPMSNTMAARMAYIMDFPDPGAIQQGLSARKKK